MDHRTLYRAAGALFLIAAIAFAVTGAWPIAGVLLVVCIVCLVAAARRTDADR
jgi:uncharacterized membrane protein